MRRENTPDKGVGTSSLDRRGFIKGAAAGAVAMGFPAIVRSASDRKIVIRDPGGPFTPGFSAAYYEPFTKATGITAVGVPGAHEPTGKIKAMIEAKTYTWDMALLSKSSHQSLVNIGYLEPIAGPGIGANVGQIPDNMKGEFIVGNDVYATIMVSKNSANGGKVPSTWAEFWDTGAFKGVRSMHKQVFDIVEFALMADGVAADKLYPPDVDRAFKKMDEIKDEVAIWWTGGAQTSQLIKSAEVDFIYTWNGRAQAAIDAGADFTINWNQGMWTYEGWCILKGGPNADLCREFIEFAAAGDAQARYTPHVAYGPTNPAAFEYVDPERAKLLPTNPQYLANLVETNTDWWGENKDMMDERFNTWLLT